MTVTALAFVDFETRSDADVTKCGAYAYARHPTTEGIVLGYALDDADAHVWSPPWCWSDRPNAVPQDLFDHVEAGGFLVAWNANFDRQIWNEVMVPKYGWPPAPIEQWLCAQAQAEANNLPGGLEKACDALGTKFRKNKQGSKLIAQLSVGNKKNWSKNFERPQGKQDMSSMGSFRVYCRFDVVSMREAWQTCRPLTLEEWAEYHVSEQVNDRGVAVDIVFAKAAAEFATEEKADLNAQLEVLTGDKQITVTNHIRKARWLHDQLWPSEDLQSIVTKPPKVEGGPPRYSADRERREFVQAALAQPLYADMFEPDHLADVVEFIEVVEAGNSAAVNKFNAICRTQYGGRIHGQYSFNGAGQTGRFSSRGVQVHNLIRDPVEKGNPDRAVDAIDDILAGANADDLAATYGFTISRLLARLIRPTFIAADGKTLVWCDWAGIEARVLPWLANSPAAEAQLDIFRSGADVYLFAAMPIYGLSDPAHVDPGQRQVGKVSTLALGFGGGVGAFAAMSRGYGVIVAEDQAREIVQAWRLSNNWAVRFWDQLWTAALGAHASPGTWFNAGRVRYLYTPDLMRGTLVCQLPCGRLIVYPQFRHDRYKDDEGKLRWRTDCVRGFGSGSGRSKLWHGTLAENITQGTAASLLRRALLETGGDNWAEQYPVVLHTHDEIVLEVPTEFVEYASEDLIDLMLEIPDWAVGLPLAVEAESGPFYTK